MDDNGYQKFRVSSMGDHEVDVDDDPRDTLIRLFLESRTGDRIALEIPHEMWIEVFEFLSAAMKEFPGGSLRQ